MEPSKGLTWTSYSKFKGKRIEIIIFYYNFGAVEMSVVFFVLFQHKSNFENENKCLANTYV